MSRSILELILFIIHVGAGGLKGIPGDKIHQTWALYFAKFIEAYKDKGINMWGVTVQNEPSDGFIPRYVLLSK